MGDLVTLPPGFSGNKTLSAAEHHAAVSALSKLQSTQGVASVFGGSLRSATLSGGTLQQDGIKFAGGVHSGATPAFGADHAVSGSAFSSTAEAAKAAAGIGHVGLSTDTIKLAGTTAASVKSETVQ